MNSLFDKIYSNNRIAFLFFAILSMFFFVGLGSVHLFDWDEINFAESAREMIESKDYMRVQINYTSFWEKPPFFIWLQVGAMKLFGENEFAARFPNALFGFIYLTTLYFIGKRHYSAKFGMIWALLFFGSLLPHIYFKSGIMDPVFNYFIFMSIYFMLMVVGKVEQHANRFAVLAGVFSGLSVVTKGPVGFLLLGLTLLVYLVIKKFKPFPSLKSIGLFFLGLFIILASWLAMELYQNGLDVMIQFIKYQMELFSSDVAGHKQPFYYHFVVVFIGCFPISILALPSFARSKEDSPYDLRTWMLCLFWVVMIVFSITTTKIIHYSSMTYIPLAFLAALFVYKTIEGEVNIKKYVKALFLVMGIILGLLFTLLPILIINKEVLYPYINDDFAIDSLATSTNWSGFEPLIGVLFIVFIIIAFVYLVKGRIMKGIVTSCLGMGATLLLILFFILPKIEGFTQGPVVEFYEGLVGEDCYVDSYGYKSYAQYYYSKQPYGLDERRKDLTWLLTGDVDKRVYLVSKSTNDELDTHPNFKILKKEGGFNFYIRELE
jgi:Dolichyl-phosphate-mannose-protein mannosyltransferase